MSPLSVPTVAARRHRTVVVIAVMAAAITAQHVSTRGVDASSADLTSSYTANRVTTTLIVPNRVYRWNALIAVQVRVDNHSKHVDLVAKTSDCNPHDFYVQPVTASGSVLQSTTLHFLMYFGCHYLPSDYVPPGHSLTRAEYIVLRASRLQLNLGRSIPPPIRLRMRIGGPPAIITFHSSPNLHADVTAPGNPNSPIMYVDVLSCSGATGSAEHAFWAVAPHGQIDAPATIRHPAGCTWDLAVARLGYPVRTVRYVVPG